MMNYIVYLTMVLSLCFVGCDGIDEQLKKPDNLNLMLMETARNRTVFAGDTVIVRVLAGTNNALRAMEISNKSHDFEVLTDSVSCEMVDKPLSIDRNGRFSRPVSTALINIPWVIPGGLKKAKVSADITITTDKGKQETIHVSMEIVTFKSWDTPLGFENDFGTPMAQPFYSSADHLLYDYQTYKRAKKRIDIYQYVDPTRILYLQSPASQLTANYVTYPWIAPDYKKEEMNNTLFIPMPGIDYEEVDDSIFDAMDFSLATEQIKIEKDDVVGFLTQDGRKGILQVKNVVDLLYVLQTSFVVKIQKNPQK